MADEPVAQDATDSFGARWLVHLGCGESVYGVEVRAWDAKIELFGINGRATAFFPRIYA